MKRTLTYLMTAALPLLFAFCASIQPAALNSSINVPDLTEANYKQIDTAQQVVGIYLYNSKLGADHIASGDNTASIFIEALQPQVKFYKLNVATFSGSAQKNLVQKYLGKPILPSYLFIYNNKLVAKKIGSYSKQEEAKKGAEEIKKGLEATIRRRK